MSIYKVIGIMSGTSLDGVDIVYVEISNQKEYKYQIHCAKTYAYSKEWELSLKKAFTSSKEDLQKLDVSYGQYLGNLVEGFRDEFKIEKIDLVASHGHTIFHKPDQGYTLQIGCGKEIAKKTNCKVVYDFRTQDVALGGQGAPLVPIGDVLLFSEFDACLNLGGFANISFDNGGIRKAFDICPVNIVMNVFAQKLGKPYDDKGAIAKTGSIHEELLNKLNSNEFYTTTKPKSLGYEFVAAEVLPVIENYQIEPQDALSTYLTHVVFQIASIIKPLHIKNILVTGGGAYNNFLIEKLQEYSKVTIEVPKSELVEYKEALIFALLGVLRVENKSNCLASVTGAVQNHSSGKIVSLKD